MEAGNWAGMMYLSPRIKISQISLVCEFVTGPQQSFSFLLINVHLSIYIQSVPKKMSFLGKIAITTFKLIQNAKSGGVLENSGYLLPDGH